MPGRGRNRLQRPGRLPSLMALAWALLSMPVWTLISCGHRPVESDAEAQPAAVVTRRTPAELWADSVMAGLTMEQKVGQLLVPAVYSRLDDATVRQLRRYVADYHVGGVLLLQGTVEQCTRLCDSLSRISAVPLWMAIDAEWGLGMRLEGAPVYPRASRLGQSSTEQEMHDYGMEIARQCREVGLNMVLGPVLDLSGAGGSIGSRSLGTDPERVARLGIAYARGLREGGVVPVAKHFPGHGAAPGDSHHTLPAIGASLHELQERDLYPFRCYVDSGLPAVMVGHLAVPAVDPERRAASVSPVVVSGLLRRDLHFGGLVLTDALNMAGADGRGALEALKAGADIVLCPIDTRKEYRTVLEAVLAGQWPEDSLDSRCRRSLVNKYPTLRRSAAGETVKN